jgi:hypothetical protein
LEGYVRPAVNQRKERERRAKIAAEAPATIPLELARTKGRLRGAPRHGDQSTTINIPTTKEYGNAVGDRRWLEAAREAGFIEPIGEEEQEIPAGAKWRYTGPLIATAAYWNWPMGGNICQAWSFVRDEDGGYVVGEGNFQLKRPCSSVPIVGGTVCIPHGGGITRVKRAAELRLLSAADSVIGALITIALDTKQDARARVQAINSVLDRAQIKGITQIELDVPLNKEIAKAAFGKAWGSEEDEDEE